MADQGKAQKLIGPLLYGIDLTLNVWVECWCRKHLNYVCPACSVRQALQTLKATAEADGFRAIEVELCHNCAGNGVNTSGVACVHCAGLGVEP